MSSRSGDGTAPGSAGDPGANPLIRLDHVSKSYGVVRALDSVSLELRTGEVHCIAGENGAGKSTLIKVLTGAVARTAGDYMVRGAHIPRQVSPTDMRNKGVGAVYQELSLFPELSVLDNLLMGTYSSAGGFLRGAQNIREAETHLRRVGLADLSLHALVADLPTATRQLVEIARVLGNNADFVIFDEPTTALSDHEASELLARIAGLRDEGIGILYVTHRIEEMFEIGDRVTVLRDGELVATRPMNSYTPDTLVEAMVGRTLEDLYPGDRIQVGEPVLEVDDLEVSGYHDPVSFTVHSGEILGVAGLLGSGRSEILRAVFGADPQHGGSVKVQGRPVKFSSPGTASRSGIGMLSEDRKESGILEQLSIRENLAVAGYAKLARAGWLSTNRIDAYVSNATKGLRVKYGRLEDDITSLSGGNQQKVLIARWLGMGAKVLLLDEPTKGIDVGAKVDIYQAIVDLAATGMGFVIVSSYLPELIGLCHRIMVVRDHALVGDVPAQDATEESIMHMASIDTAHQFSDEDTDVVQASTGRG